MERRDAGDVRCAVGSRRVCVWCGGRGGGRHGGVMMTRHSVCPAYVHRASRFFLFCVRIEIEMNERLELPPTAFLHPLSSLTTYGCFPSETVTQ